MANAITMRMPEKPFKVRRTSVKVDKMPAERERVNAAVSRLVDKGVITWAQVAGYPHDPAAAKAIGDALAKAGLRPPGEPPKEAVHIEEHEFQPIGVKIVPGKIITESGLEFRLPEPTGEEHGWPESRDGITTAHLRPITGSGFDPRLLEALITLKRTPIAYTFLSTPREGRVGRLEIPVLIVKDRHVSDFEKYTGGHVRELAFRREGAALKSDHTPVSGMPVHQERAEELMKYRPDLKPSDLLEALRLNLRKIKAENRVEEEFMLNHAAWEGGASMLRPLALVWNIQSRKWLIMEDAGNELRKEFVESVMQFNATKNQAQLEQIERLVRAAIVAGRSFNRAGFVSGDLKSQNLVVHKTWDGRLLVEATDVHPHRFTAEDKETLKTADILSQRWELYPERFERQLAARDSARSLEMMDRDYAALVSNDLQAAFGTLKPKLSPATSKLVGSIFKKLEKELVPRQARR